MPAPHPSLTFRPFTSLLHGGIAAVTASAILLVAGCASTPERKVTQFTTIDALLAGVYDGEFPCRQVSSHGDLGLGTFDKLDGEMILVDGRIYQAKADGTVHLAPRHLSSPFATVTHFKANQIRRTTSPLTLSELEHTLNDICQNPNGVYAIRIRGAFPSMKLRSVPAQKKPYRELVDVVKDQTFFNVGPVRGTLVGFRFPAYFKGINAPGYHLHFLSDDKKTGGHVLGLQMAEDAIIETSDALRFELFFPDPDGAFSQAALSHDRSEELRKVER